MPSRTSPKPAKSGERAVASILRRSRLYRSNMLGLGPNRRAASKQGGNDEPGPSIDSRKSEVDRSEKERRLGTSDSQGQGRRVNEKIERGVR